MMNERYPFAVPALLARVPARPKWLAPGQRRRLGRGACRRIDRRSSLPVVVSIVVVLAMVAGSQSGVAQTIPSESRVLDLGRLEKNGAAERAGEFRTALEQRLTNLQAAREQVARAKEKYEQNPCDETEAELLDATARAFVLEFRADQRIVEIGDPLVGELQAAAAALSAAEEATDDEIRTYESAAERHMTESDELGEHIRNIALSVNLDSDEPLPRDVVAAVALADAEAGRERRLSEANQTVADNTRLTRENYKSYVAALENCTTQVQSAVSGAQSRLIEIGEIGRLMQSECDRARRGRAAGQFVDELGGLAELIGEISRAEPNWAVPRVAGNAPIDTRPSDEHVKQVLRKYLEEHNRASVEHSGDDGNAG